MVPIDLIAAVVAWLVATAGNSGVELVRGSSDERMLRQAVSVAIARVVRQVDACLREQLRDTLAWCFSAQPRYTPDGATSIDVLLRAAVAAQLANIDPDSFGADRLLNQDGWLEEELSIALVAALRQVVAASGVIELVHGLDFADLKGRLDVIGFQVGQLAQSSTALQICALAAVARAEPGQALEVSRTLSDGLLSRRQDWLSAVQSFADMEHPEFRLDVLQLMGEALGLAHPFGASYRPMARDHVNQIITRCREYPEPDLAFAALARALVMLRPDTRAARTIQEMLIESDNDDGNRD